VKLRRTSYRSLAAAAALSAALVSCSNPIGPRADMLAVEGNYFTNLPGTADVAGAFSVTENGVTTDMLGRGAFIGLILQALPGGVGTTDGRLLIPGEIDIRLPGTWTLDGGVVRLSHEADTFLRDMELRVTDDRLEGEWVSDGVAVRVVLQRGPGVYQRRP
jgi:hypothetical protein